MVTHYRIPCPNVGDNGHDCDGTLAFTPIGNTVKGVFAVVCNKCKHVATITMERDSAIVDLSKGRVDAVNIPTIARKS